MVYAWLLLYARDALLLTTCARTLLWVFHRLDHLLTHDGRGSEADGVKLDGLPKLRLVRMYVVNHDLPRFFATPF